MDKFGTTVSLVPRRSIAKPKRDQMFTSGKEIEKLQLFEMDASVNKIQIRDSVKE